MTQMTGEITDVDKLLYRDPSPRAETCQTHGAYDSRNLFGSIWSGCPECDRIATEKRDQDQKAKEAKEALARWNKRIGGSGIPPRFQDRSLENFKATTEAQQRALTAAQEYVSGFAEILTTGRSVIFTGRPGTGKTHLAAAIGMALLKENRKVLFTSVLRAVRRVKDSWRRDSNETETDAIRAMVEPDLLILDEVGIQFGSETEKLLMFDILNERYENRRPLILLTNLPVKDAQAYLGERIFDRLREDGGQHIPFDWESYRGTKQ